MFRKIKSLLKKTPDEIIKNSWNSIPKEKISSLKLIISISLLTAVIDYFYLMITGYAGPDAICEGINTYVGGDNEMRSLRWFIPYLNSFVGKNVVMPSIIVLLYSLMIAVSVFLLSDMLEIKSKISNVLISAAMVSFPIVTRQYAYLCLWHIPFHF